MALTPDDKEFIIRALAAHAALSNGFGPNSLEHATRIIRGWMAGPSVEEPPPGFAFVLGQLNPVALHTPSDRPHSETASAAMHRSSADER